MILKKNLVHYWSLGLLNYLPALRIQQLLVEQHFKQEKPYENEEKNVILLVEHKPGKSVILLYSFVILHNIFLLIFSIHHWNTNNWLHRSRAATTDRFGRRILSNKSRWIDNFSWAWSVGCISNTEFGSVQQKYEVVYL